MTFVSGALASDLTNIAGTHAAVNQRNTAGTVAAEQVSHVHS